MLPSAYDIFLDNFLSAGNVASAKDLGTDCKHQTRNANEDQRFTKPDAAAHHHFHVIVISKGIHRIENTQGIPQGRGKT